MKSASALAFITLSLASGCVKLAPTPQAQKAALADSIHFTQLTVAGNTVLFELARADSGYPTARQSDIDPIDFPEYISYKKDAQGLLTVVKAHMGISSSDARCTDAACSGIQMTLTRPGGTLGDTTMIKASRVSGATCTSTIIDGNGVRTTLAPKFDLATVTTILTLNPRLCVYEDGSGRGFYGRATYTDSTTGYLTGVSLRTFVGAPADLWIDEAQNAVQSDGRLSRVSTVAQTFQIYDQDPQTNSLGFYASDAEGRSATVGCTSANPMTVPAAPPITCTH